MHNSLHRYTQKMSKQLRPIVILLKLLYCEISKLTPCASGNLLP